MTKSFISLMRSSHRLDRERQFRIAIIPTVLDSNAVIKIAREMSPRRRSPQHRCRTFADHFDGRDSPLALSVHREFSKREILKRSIAGCADN